MLHAFRQGGFFFSCGCPRPSPVSASLAYCLSSAPLVVGYCRCGALAGLRVFGETKSLWGPWASLWVRTLPWGTGGGGLGGLVRGAYMAALDLFCLVCFRNCWLFCFEPPCVALGDPWVGPWGATWGFFGNGF